MIRKPLLPLILFSLSYLYSQELGYTFPNSIRFPYGPIQDPFMGIFVAISYPIEVDNYDLFFSFVIEANYVVPSNQSNFTYPPIISKRSWSRKFIYEILENKLKTFGFGKECLLRAICDGSQYSSLNTGVLGDIIHILLTPSSSTNENLTVYEKAEIIGKTNKTCASVYECPLSLLDLVSWIGPFMHL